MHEDGILDYVPDHQHGKYRDVDCLQFCEDAKCVKLKCSLHVQVDVRQPDSKRHSLFTEVPYRECRLQQGEMLYIPKKWWHFVASCSASLSISFWWT